MRTILTIIIFAAVLSSPALAQDAGTILDKQVEALGGKENVIKSSDYYAEGSVSVQTLSGTFKVWERTPYYNRTEADLKVIKIKQGFNGKYKWNIDQNGKLTKQDDAETVTDEINESRIKRNDYLTDRESFEITYGGEEAYEGKPYYIVKVKYKDVPERKLFIDKDTYLTYRIEFTDNSEQHWSEFMDYRPLQGTLFPYSVKSFDGANLITVKFETVNIGGDMAEALFEPEGKSTEDFVFPNNKEFVEVPFEIIGNHIFVRASVNKGDKRIFFFDTGAGVNVISLDYARAMGLPLSDPIKGQGVGGNQEIYPVSYNSFELGDISFGSQTVFAIDMNNIVEKMGFEFAGIIGMDFINRFVVKIDYDNKMLTFYKPADFKYTGSGKEVEMNGITVTATLNGKHKGKFNLDTGAGSLSLNQPFVEKMGWFKRTDELPRTYSIGVGNNKIPTYSTIFDEFEIGGYKLTDVPVQFTQADSGVFKGDELMGNIGNSIFRNFVMYFDHNGGRVILEPGRNMNVFNSNGHGLGISWNRKDNFYYVDNITTLSPASRSGIAIGDVVLAINGTEVNSGSITAIYNNMFNEPEDIILKVKRGNEIKEITVKYEVYVKKFEE